MPGLRPKATPISFDPPANGYHTPPVKSPTATQANCTNGQEAKNKNTTSETQYTQDFTDTGNKAGQSDAAEHLNVKDVQPVNSPPPKAAKLDSSPPGKSLSIK